MSEELLPVIEQQPDATPTGPRHAPVPFTILALLIVFVLYQGLGGVATFLLFGAEVTRETVSAIRTATMISQFLFLLAPTFLLLQYQHGAAFSTLPFRIPKASEVLLVVVCVASLQQVLEGYLYLQDMIPLPSAVQNALDMMKRTIEETMRLLGEAHSPLELLYVVLVVAVTPAICEELFFRGLIQKNLMLASTPRKGIIATGIIFGIYHFNPFLIVPLCVLGIFFGYVRVRSNTLILPILAHFVNNAVSAAGFFWQQQQRTVGAFLLEGAEADVPIQYVLGVTIVSLIVFVMCIVFYRSVTQDVERT